MAVLFSPWGNQQFFDESGNPATGWKIYSYTAGSSTALATYTTSAGSVSQSNPVVLDALGFSTGGQIWLTSGLSYKLVLTDANGIVKKTEDNITGVTSAAAVSQWLASGLTPTYVSATSFTLAGDQTSALHAGRRLQTTNTSGTIYSTVLSSVFAALTTVTVVNDSGVLDSGLSQLNYGLLTAVSPSLPDSPAARTSLGVYQGGYLFGCTMSTAGSSATMSIAGGTAMNSTGAQLMTLTAIAKTTSAWAVGTAAGGLDTGAIANSTGYHFYVIRRPDTGVVDVVFSTNATTPTLPTNYTQYRRIGWGRTNGSAQWLLFTQDGDYFQWAAPPLDVNQTTSGTAAVLRTLTVPIGVPVRVMLNMQMTAGGSGEILLVSDPSTTDAVPVSSAVSPLNSMFTGASSTTSAQVMSRTNTSGQIRTRQAAGGATETLRGALVAWFDTRGRDA